jgi:hypothetical protein
MMYEEEAIVHCVLPGTGNICVRNSYAQNIAKGKIIVSRGRNV